MTGRPTAVDQGRFVKRLLANELANESADNLAGSKGAQVTPPDRAGNARIAVAPLLLVLLCCSQSLNAAALAADAPDPVDPLFRTQSEVTPTPAPTVLITDTGPLSNVGYTADQRLLDDPRYAQLSQQIQLQEFRPVLRTTEQLIEQIETEQERYARDLVEPLLLQGDALVGLGNLELALESYSRAVHVQRVNDGLYAPDQVSAVYREANVLKLLGLTDEASDREEYAYTVLTRSFGPLSPKLLPGLYHLADWHNRTRNIYEARDLYRRAINIIEANYADNSSLLIDPLVGLARTYFREAFPPFFAADSAESLNPPEFRSAPPANFPGANRPRPTRVNNYSAGERALERVVRIRSAQPDSSAAERSDAFLKLADWHLLFEKYRDAHRLYLEAQAVLAEDDEARSIRLLAEPTLLHFPRPTNPRPPPPQSRGDEKTGFVEVIVNVTARGTVNSVRAVASEPAGLMDFRVRKSIRSARYRPAMLDGNLVGQEDLKYRYEFTYFETVSEAEAAGSEPRSAGPDRDAPKALNGQVSATSDSTGQADGQ